MKSLSLKRNLAEGKVQYGLMNSIPDPLVIEIIAASGYDFVVIDTEHVAINDETLAHMIRAAETANIIPIVRVTAAIERDIIKVLDMGAKGIVVPHVNDRETAERIVKLSRYYPEGMRSLNGGRVARFGEIPLKEAMAEANASICVIAMIENMQGVRAIDEIVQVEGLDMVVKVRLTYPNHSASLGKQAMINFNERFSMSTQLRQLQANSFALCREMTNKCNDGNSKACNVSSWAMTAGNCTVI